MWTQSMSVTDGRTDRITITKTVQRIASHGKNVAVYFLNHSLCINIYDIFYCFNQKHLTYLCRFSSDGVVYRRFTFHLWTRFSRL